MNQRLEIIRPERLIDVLDAINCYIRRESSWPSSTGGLVGSKCLDLVGLGGGAGRVIAPESFDFYDGWERSFDVMILVGGNLSLPPDAIVAVALPTVAIPNIAITITRDGAVEAVSRSQWAQDREAWSRKLRGLEIWAKP
ncbi:MAG: hypothetical protein SFY95_09270 [Planctomycetota bacterium]|nr:hypothetical protein [Planctomycetota bacterium]